MSEIEDVLKSDEDNDADLIKAKIRRLDAESALFDIQAEIAKQDAFEAELSSRLSVIKFDEINEAYKIHKASDDPRHRVYRFNTLVRSDSVKQCESVLTLWSRMDESGTFEIIFSSPGGSIIDGMSLFDTIQGIRNQGHKVITGGTGMAASMAGILLQAGDYRWLGEQTWLLLHRPSFTSGGNLNEVEDQLTLIKRFEQRIIDIFVSRSKLSEEEIRKNWERKDWWINPEEALELGLIDEIRNSMPEMKKNEATNT